MLASLAGTIADLGENWDEALERWLNEVGQSAGNPGPAAESVLKAFPGLAQEGVRPPNGPILGLAPHHQRNARDFLQCYLDWQQALLAWQRPVRRAATKALKEFRAACLQSHADATADELTEMAACCLERNHQALLDDEDFIALQARLEQHRLRLQDTARRLARPLWRELGLATDEDLLSLRQRHREELDAIRRELAELRSTIHRREQCKDD